MANKFSDDELQALYKIAAEQGWDALDIPERMALDRWCKKNHIDRPGMTPTVPSPESVPVGAATVSVLPAVSPVVGEVVVPMVGESALSVVRGMRWYGQEWPEATVVTPVVGPKYGREAGALREFVGRVGRVAGCLERAQAMNVKQGVNSGHLKAFAPRGSFEARIMPEDGAWSVLARFVGER